MSFEMISLILNALLGGGIIVTMTTIKYQRNKAAAEAKGAEASAESSELDNVDKAVKIWRDLAESMELRNKELRELIELSNQRNAELEKTLLAEIELLRREVKKQNTTINKILKILDSIDHDNLEEKIKEAKDIAS